MDVPAWRKSRAAVSGLPMKPGATNISKKKASRWRGVIIPL